MKMEFKSEFIKRTKELMGRESGELLEWLMKPLKQAIRVNTLKISVNDLLSRLKLKGWSIRKVDFAEGGFWIDEREESLGNTIEHFLGYYYAQEPASMIPPLILKPEKDDVVLDCCASPGSKTTQMAAMMNNQGLIIANDVSIDRIKILKINMQRMGVSCGVITRRSGQAFSRMTDFFDKVLIDAPCSAEGAMRKKPYIAQEWRVNMIAKLSAIQNQLIEAGFKSLKQGGSLVYSTCTLAPEENEGTINFLLNKYPNARLEKVELSGLKTRPGITSWEGKSFNDEVTNTARIYPMDNDTEGFYVAKVIKE